MNDTVRNEEVVVKIPVQEPLTQQTQTEATITTTISSAPKKLEIIPNWRHVLMTYSFWTMVASVLLSLVEQVLPFLGLLEPTMSTTVYGITMFCLNVSAVVFRMIKQRKLWVFDPKTGEVMVGDKPNESSP